ncbi:MAG TPA: aminoglycoside phosphotransferase family protein [Chitinophagaceae bacterium]
MQNAPTLLNKKLVVLVRQLMKHHFGRKKLQISVLSGGITNFVYSVKSGKEELVVRLGRNPDKINFFLKEQWAVARALEKGIPVPEILEVGNSIIPMPYMIMKKINGEEASDHLDRSLIINEMGRYASIIHTIPTHDYGHSFDWSQNILSRNINWKDYLYDELQFEERMDFLKSNRLLTTKTFGKLKSLIHIIEQWKGKPCLHHGDLRLKNILVDKKGKIVSIIDWENCVSSIPPYWDISIALHDLSIDKQGYFLEGYGLTGKMTLKIAPALKVFNILNYVPEMQKMLQQRRKQKEKLEHYRARLGGALDMFSL